MEGMSGSHSASPFLLLIGDCFSILVIYLWNLKCSSDCHTFCGLSYYGKAVKLICGRVRRYFCFLGWEQNSKHSMKRHSVSQEKLTLCQA